MVKELELAAAGAASGLAKLSRRKKPHPEHTYTHCLNCGAELYGRYCAQCGQSADDHHRSIFHLLWEAVEGLTHLDGRLARTLPALFFRPGLLARDHIEGRRTRHVPPFRLFLISLLIFMLALETAVHRGSGHTAVNVVRNGAPQPAAAGGTPTVQIGGGLIQVGRGPPSKAQNEKDAQAALQKFDQNTHKSALGRWISDRVKRANANRDYYKTIVFEWAHRLAILLLPIFALLLAGLYFYKRRFYVYDHLIVSMQFLSFQFLLWAVAWIMPDPLREWAFLIALLWTPVNLFMTLRGAYGSSIIGAGLKTVFLWFSTMLVFSLLLVAILAVALNQL